ncbi:YicC/YloC family endoribonuclease [Oryzifoliimicrobium ureilyticus]|uniref:YicC/YloC family endoribonuclease n=1 Tax=Oryzifoliimicrobium ureilyticus TaxID=3113724 RepID=UPI0030762654
MALQSMTGFARSEGTSGRWRWAWELRSVNGKGLDVRLRLPQGFEKFENDVRRLFSERFSRGNIQAGLSLTSSENRVQTVVNEEALAAILDLREKLSGVIDASPIKLDTLLAIRGVVEFREMQDQEDEIAARDQDILSGLSQAIDDLGSMRAREGEVLSTVLLEHVATIERLTAIIESDKSRQPAEIAERLRVQLDALMETGSSLDRERLYAEAALLATKADLREEIDRLKAHVKAARDLLAAGGATGRKLDFLAQEFNREANTICSKSNASVVTAAGIELKVVIDQFREQVQNLE